MKGLQKLQDFCSIENSKKNLSDVLADGHISDTSEIQKRVFPMFLTDPNTPCIGGTKDPDGAVLIA